MSTIASFFRRNSTTIGVVIITACFLLILYVQSLATSKLQDEVQGQQEIIAQIKGVTDQIHISSVDRTKEINQINRHLDCIVTFFAQRERSNAAIANIDTCTITSLTTGVTQTFNSSTKMNGPIAISPAPSSQSNNNSVSSGKTNSSPVTTPSPKTTFTDKAILGPLSDFLKSL